MSRDDQFSGFALALACELDKQFGAVIEWGAENDITEEAKIEQELRSRWQKVIARAAYDLVEHTMAFQKTEEYGDIDAIPDLPVLPEEKGK